MAEPTDAIIAYDLDEGTGTTAANSGSEGSSWDMTAAGTTAWVTGPGGGNSSTDDAIDLTGAGHFDTATGLTHPLSGDDVTLAVLARLDTDDDDQGLVQLGTIDDGVYIQPWSDEYLYAGWSHNGNLHDIALDYDDIEGTGLYHRYVLTVTDNGSTRTAKLYFDGTLVGSTESTDTLDTALDRFIAGATTTGGDDWLDGRIASIRVYDRVLSAAEREALFTDSTTVYPHPSEFALEFQGGALVDPDPGAAYPASPLQIKVEIELNTVWTDITPYVMRRDGIHITRGVPDELSSPEPSTCRFTLNNRDGRFSPRNPTGAYSGHIGRNTQVRVTVRRNGTSYPRFHGEISTWPPQWDPTGTDVYTTVVASGILRRLQQGNSPAHSTMRRGAEALASGVSYWPIEEPAGAQTATAVFGGETLKPEIEPTDFGAYSEFPSSAPIVTLDAGELFGQPTWYPITGETQVIFLLAVADSGMDNTVQSILQVFGSGSVRRFDVAWTDTDSGSLRVDFDDDDLSTITTSSELKAQVNGKRLLVSCELRKSGSDLKYKLRVIEFGKDGTQSISGTLTGESFNRAFRVKFNNDGGLNGSAVGHLVLLNNVTSLNAIRDQFNGYGGEAAGRRLQRLCTENDVPFVLLSGGLDDTERVGPQRVNTLVDLLVETAAVDLGFLFEPRDQFGLAYRTRKSLYNRSPSLTFDYEDNLLSEPPLPVEDDDATRNDITAKSQSGGSRRQVFETGPLSVLAPPNGVGLYDDEVTVNVAGDAQLDDQAGWRLKLGTIDEARFPQISVNMGTPAVVADTALTADIMECDVGDIIRLTDLPSWQPPEDVDQVVVGYTETISNFEHDIVFTCVPASPYTVAVRGTSLRDTAGTTLGEDVDTTETSIIMEIDPLPLWTTESGDFPFDINVGGEQMTVTAITGSSSPQTFTVTRSVNGVVKEHAEFDPVRLWQPAHRAL